jgi:hypothetical protein
MVISCCKFGYAEDGSISHIELQNIIRSDAGIFDAIKEEIGIFLI